MSTGTPNSATLPAAVPANQPPLIPVSPTVLLATIWSLTCLCSRGIPGEFSSGGCLVWGAPFSGTSTHQPCSSISTVSPTGSQWLLCQSQGRCGDKIFNPLTHCCYDDAVVARSTQRRCGNCTFRICEEQCCPGLLPAVHTLVVKDRGHSCSAAPKSEDRICRR